MNDTLEDRVFSAAWACPHSIERDRVVLEFDPRKPGHNALNQLHTRISEAIRAAVPADRAALAEEAKRLAYETACHTGVGEWSAVAIARTELHAAIDALAAAAPPVSDARDAARLDWLDRQWTDGVHLEVYAKAIRPECYAPGATVYHKGEYPAATVREAIDAAMAPPEQGVQS